MDASPAPRRPSRAWIWIIAVGVAVLAGLIATVLSAPMWAAPLVRDAVVEKLGKRFGMPVAIETFELGWGSAHLENLQLGDETGPSIALADIAVTLDSSEMWSGRAVVRAVTATGGRIEGTRAQLRELADRVLTRKPQPEPRAEGRVAIVPDDARLTDVWVVVSEPGDSERDRRLEARVTATAAPKEKRVELVLHDVRLDPGTGPVVTATSVATELSARRTETGHAVAFPLDVEVRGVGAPVTEEIAVAAVDGTVRIADAGMSEVSVDLEGAFSDTSAGQTEGAKLWSLTGTVRRDLSHGVLRLNMESFELGRVPQVLKSLPLRDSQTATVGGRLAVMFGGGVAMLEGQVAVAGLNVEHRTLAREVVGGIGFELDFAARVDPAARAVTIDQATLSREGVKLELAGEFVHPPQVGGRRYQATLKVPAVPCQAVLDAIPHEMAPGLAGFELGGEFHADVDVDVNYSDLDELVLGGSVGIFKCKATKVPPDASAARLASGFTHRVTMRDGRVRSVQMYPGSSSFTKLGAISPYMVQAVLTTEDGGFWRHRGFLPSQFRVALQRNLKAGRIRLGASTITMQMVKNVLLSHERTLARKLQELFLTWYVETALSKSRIMELYLNAIEFGPGIYGVTRAAKHYFGKHPGDLTPPEAVYLGLMLPSPVRRHASYCKGELTNSMRASVQRILLIMNSRGRLSDLDLEVWKDVDPEFDRRDQAAQGACFGEIKRLMAARKGQRAITGLLGSGAQDDPVIVEDDGDDREDRVPKRQDPVPEPEPQDSDAPGEPEMDAVLDQEQETW